MWADDVPAARRSPTVRTSTSFAPGRKSRVSIVRESLSALRESLLSRLPPLPKSLAAMTAPVAALVVIGVVGVTLVVWMAFTGRLPGVAGGMLGGDPPKTAELTPPPLSDRVELDDEELAGPSAKPGRANVGRGVLAIPPTFRAKEDGAFDLVVHFHGNTELAVESYEVALLDTVVLVINMGNGSGIYEERFGNPDSLSRILERVPQILERRGLKGAAVRRVALAAWSAGYGAVIRTLEHRPHAERVDAVLLLDGLHTSYKEGTREVEAASLASTEAFARRAMAGEKLLVITHSNIEPVGYLGVRETVDFLLGRLDLERSAVSMKTEIPALQAAKGVLPKDDLRPLELRSEVRSGSLVVRGFGGDQAAHHISHLMQMSQLALPELAKRWAAADRAP